MPKNTPPPICTTCGKPKKWLPAKKGGRAYQCVNCEDTNARKEPSEAMKALFGTFWNQFSAKHP